MAVSDQVKVDGAETVDKVKVPEEVLVAAGKVPEVDLVPDKVEEVDRVEALVDLAADPGDLGADQGDLGDLGAVSVVGEVTAKGGLVDPEDLAAMVRVEDVATDKVMVVAVDEMEGAEAEMAAVVPVEEQAEEPVVLELEKQKLFSGLRPLSIPCKWIFRNLLKES